MRRKIERAIDQIIVVCCVLVDIIVFSENGIITSMAPNQIQRKLNKTKTNKPRRREKAKQECGLRRIHWFLLIIREIFSLRK
jgi:hypothetical protein